MGSPLRSVSPKTFVFKEFKDVRGAADPMLLMKAPFNEWKMAQTTAVVIATAIKREFEVNGHTCLEDTPQPKPDFVVDGTIYKYGVTVGAGGGAFKQKFRAEVAMNLTVRSVSDAKRILIKEYKGEYAGFTGSIGSGTLQSCQMGGLQFCELLKAALFEMIEEISTDPELIAFIEK